MIDSMNMDKNSNSTDIINYFYYDQTKYIHHASKN